MRTTLVLDDRLARKAKAAALERGITLSEVVNQALRSTLSASPAMAEQFVMTTHGDKRVPVDHEPRDFWAYQDGEDESRLR